ncbi:ribonucleoside triphosphate reductase [Candidatus Woesearchaeota archaeon]|nr:ribonucleoside triphosphate reductase [Candidatus Woesearchaeota archaeon]
MDEITKVKRVQKRDGQLILFDENSITDTIFKAVKAVGQDDYNKAKFLSLKVASVLDIFFKGGVIPTVEMIQDLIEKVLIESSEVDIAKAFIIYRDQRRRLREEDQAMMNVTATMDGYLRQSDWRVAENANINYSYSGLIMHAATSVVAHYTLSSIYPKEIADAHRNADLHIHDLGWGIVGYCAGWSLRQLLSEGFNGVPGKIDSKPSKHLDSSLWQIINFIGTLQNEWAGAQAFSSFDTYLAPLIKIDNLEYKKVKQAIQGFIFNMNVPTRWGGQTPFSNLTFDWIVPDDMRNRKALVGGKEVDFTYGECQKEMDIINKAFMEVITEGDANGRIFTFPIPTYNITKEFDWDSENANFLFDMTAKYGIPYFQNFINSELEPSDVRSMCCRLQMDMRELRQKGGGLFGAVEMTGSIGVVTINLPRLGYCSKTKEELFERVAKLMDLSKESLEIKRKLVQRNMDNGLMPYTKRYLGTLQNHFNTIGVNGMNEMLMNFFGADVTVGTKKGIAFAEEVLDFMRDRLMKYQEETDHIYNLEATPAEGTAYRFAKHDKERYPDILSSGQETPYYTNSSQLPVNFTTDIFEALELQDSLQSKYTGGTVLHGFLGERVGDPETCKKLVKRIAYNFKLPYFTITPTFSVCPKHGYIPGRHENCPFEDEAESSSIETRPELM